MKQAKQVELKVFTSKLIDYFFIGILYVGYFYVADFQMLIRVFVLFLSLLVVLKIRFNFLAKNLCF